jgi:hypothetical protein
LVVLEISERCTNGPHDKLLVPGRQVQNCAGLALGHDRFGRRDAESSQGLHDVRCERDQAESLGDSIAGDSELVGELGPGSTLPQTGSLTLLYQPVLMAS